MASEKLLEPNLVRKIKSAGGQCYKLIAVSITGFPDRTILLPGGRIYFAEIKTTGKDLQPNQKIMRKLLIGLGFQYFVIDSEESLENCLKEIL